MLTQDKNTPEGIFLKTCNRNSGKKKLINGFCYKLIIKVEKAYYNL